MDELATCLRAWRDRLGPAEVGLPTGARRRAPGLRREELAGLAGLSVDYLSRLEQGRASTPSASVLEPLARALRLCDEERAHLFRVAGHGPDEGHVRRHVTPGVQRVLDRLGDVPVIVCDAGWDVVTRNRLAAALFGTESDPDIARVNVVREAFQAAAGRVAHTPQALAEFKLGLVADLHASVGRHPTDPRLRRVVDELLTASPEFAALWAQRPVAVHAAASKVVNHPEVGPIALDCDVLTVQGSDLRLVVLTAPPGGEAASRLALLAALGGQAFDPEGATSAGRP